AFVKSLICRAAFYGWIRKSYDWLIGKRVKRFLNVTVWPKSLRDICPLRNRSMWTNPLLVQYEWADIVLKSDLPLAFRGLAICERAAMDGSDISASDVHALPTKAGTLVAFGVTSAGFSSTPERKSGYRRASASWVISTIDTDTPSFNPLFNQSRSPREPFLAFLRVSSACLRPFKHPNTPPCQDLCPPARASGAMCAFYFSMTRVHEVHHGGDPSHACWVFH
ncbi:hypothetical protein IAQ61_010697, partial [Plenodomus lingam]|uniref:uncharacterized protein n=1 Tax=Leptosphaeria maculans TaxID=5022 RepID=UPI00331E2F3E